MTVELRALSPDDWRTWRTMRLAALTDAPRAFGSHLEDWADAEEGRWRERLSVPGAIDLLAFEAGEDTAVGMATGTPDKDDDNRAELISMWVDPAVRGRGTATALITAIAQWAASTGATVLTLSVMPDNISARRTYEKNQFTVSPEPGDLLPDGQRELIMLRTLRPERAGTDSRLSVR